LDVDRCTVAVYLNAVYLNDGSWVAMLAPAAQPGAASSYAAVKFIASTRLAAFMDFPCPASLAERRPRKSRQRPAGHSERLIDATLT
jgi:hypothetical protein